MNLTSGSLLAAGTEDPSPSGLFSCILFPPRCMITPFEICQSTELHEHFMTENQSLLKYDLLLANLSPQPSAAAYTLANYQF
jgi:hypothetical protein